MHRKQAAPKLAATRLATTRLAISRFAATRLAATLALAVWPAAGQTPTPPATTPDALRAMSDAAGIIFTGTVTAVRRPTAPGGSSGGIVEIDFAVADAIRGVASPTYTMREWAGLWAAADQPLLPGSRYLMLLHTPNAAGLTSPVAGPDGVIPIHGTGPAATPEGPPASASTTSGSAAVQVVDLGWIATQVATPVVYARRHSVSANPVTIHAHARTGADSEAAAPDGTSPVSPQVRSAPYNSVIGTLRAWEASRAGRL